MVSVQRRQWHPTPVLLPGKSHGRRSLVGCSPWGREESDTTKQLQFHFSLSCIREGIGNPFQCSCLKNLRDGGAWWAAVSGVTQSWTRLKRLSSSIYIYTHIYTHTHTHTYIYQVIRNSKFNYLNITKAFLKFLPIFKSKIMNNQHQSKF